MIIALNLILAAAIIATLTGVIVHALRSSYHNNHGLDLVGYHGPAQTQFPRGHGARTHSHAGHRSAVHSSTHRV